MLYAIMEGYSVPKGAFDIDIAGWNIIYLALETVVYFVSVFLIERLLIMPKFLNYFSK